MPKERTLVLIKPDGIQKSITGKIISRFEDAGLKITGMKMVWADDILAKKHYPLDEEWARNLFKKTKQAYAKEGKEPKYKTWEEIGKAVQSNLINFLKESPIVAMVLQGPNSIELVRKMIGATEPRQAIPGTIRADFASVECYRIADDKERAVRNLIHASDSKENAEREIATWFNPNELHDYKKELDKFF